MRSLKKTIGGIPHLDENYTVLGNVVNVISMLDSMARNKTNDHDSPLNDVIILSVTMVELSHFKITT